MGAGGCDGYFKLHFLATFRDENFGPSSVDVDIKLLFAVIGGASNA